jgi:hypothetical protein
MPIIVPSPAFSFSGAAVGEDQQYAAAGAIVATLQSLNGVDQVEWSVVGADETTAVGDYTLVPSGALGSVVSFTAGAEGTSGVLQCKVNAGVDPRTGNTGPDMQTQLVFWVPTTSGYRVKALGEDATATVRDVEVVNAVARGGAGSGVASVGATAPITSTGGTTPDIGITAATTIAAGSMSAADKLKLDAIGGITAAAPANVTKAAADVGVSTEVARADHKHDITTAVAVDVSMAASAEGAATSLARSDHTHQLPATITAGAINERVADAGVLVEGIRLEDNAGNSEIAATQALSITTSSNLNLLATGQWYGSAGASNNAIIDVVTGQKLLVRVNSADEFRVSGAGVETDAISEIGAGVGVTIDSLLVKDGRLDAAKWRTQTVTHYIDDDNTPSAAIEERAVLYVPYASTVVLCMYTSTDAVPSISDAATFIVRQRDDSGTTPLTIASMSTNGNALSALAPKSLNTITNGSIAAGFVLTFEVTKQGLGARTRGTLTIEYSID